MGMPISHRSCKHAQVQVSGSCLGLRSRKFDYRGPTASLIACGGRSVTQESLLATKLPGWLPDDVARQGPSWPGFARDFSCHGGGLSALSLCLSDSVPSRRYQLTNFSPQPSPFPPGSREWTGTDGGGTFNGSFNGAKKNGRVSEL